MPLANMGTLLRQSKEGGYGVGAFSVADMQMVKLYRQEILLNLLPHHPICDLYAMRGGMKMSTQGSLLEVRNIVKMFPGVKELKGVSMEVKAGEIHALVGENGAGKSTLMKCLIAIHPPTSGEIYFDGEIRHIYNTIQALNLGISTIHQELNAVLYRPIILSGGKPDVSVYDGTRVLEIANGCRESFESGRLHQF